MTECEEKGGSVEHIDRISDLPSDVIDAILQHLSIEELVKTSILSRKWRYKWASMLKLEFTKNFFEKCENLHYLETSSIITDAIFLHNGPVHKFALQIPSDHPVSMKGCVSKWIMFLSGKGVKHLELSMPETYTYLTPSHIFSCQDLSLLLLQGFILSTVPNYYGGFKSLVTLYLYNIIFASGAFESLVSGCSLLEVLKIYYCSGIEHINLSNPSLRCVSIGSTEAFKSIRFKQTQNLTQLTLLADKCGNNIEVGWVFDLMKDLPKIDMLCIGGVYFKHFSAIGPQVVMLLRPFNTLTYLELTGVNFNQKELVFIISLLESSPNLQELVIESTSRTVEPQMILKKLDCNDCNLSQLKYVDIKVQNAYMPALNLIRFVLANSSSLSILTFNVGLGSSKSDLRTLLDISSILLQMKRASPTVEVEFLYNK